MTKIIFSIFFSFSIITLTASDGFACSCVAMPDIPIERQVKDAFTKSSSVFVGKVIQVNKLNDYSVTVKFDVEKSWNKTFQKEISISTASDSAMCGYEFQVGKKYLVYASGENNKLSTNLCTRTASVVSNKDVTVLNKIKKPKIKSSPK
jgi:hypothetical protein